MIKRVFDRAYIYIYRKGHFFKLTLVKTCPDHPGVGDKDSWLIDLPFCGARDGDSEVIFSGDLSTVCLGGLFFCLMLKTSSSIYRIYKKN